MLRQCLSAWFGTDYSGIVKDVLSGKERVLPPVDVRRYPCRTMSACHFAALNFVRIAFKNMTTQRARRGPNSTMMRWLGAVMERRRLQQALSPCGQLTGEQAIQLEEMCRIPLFQGGLRHVATKHGAPNVTLFKQFLRQMQLHASPVSAIVVSRNASTTVCLKLRENSKDVFLVLDFELAPQGHGHSHDTTLVPVINTSLEQTAARLSGNSPIENHLTSPDRQWQNQLFTSCTICMFTPSEEVSLAPDAGSSAINEGIAFLRVMGKFDNWGRGLGREREAIRNRTRSQSRNNQPPGSKHGELEDNTPFGACNAATRCADPYTSPVASGSTGEGSSMPLEELRSKSTSIPYEQTKRHCRIFFSDDGESPSLTSCSHISLSSEESDEETYFECVICFEDIPREERARLLPCAHAFCKDCLAGHACSKIEERKFPVFCPLCITEQENMSPTVISGEMVRRIGVSEAQYAAWSELEMAYLWVRIHCHRCDHSAFVDKEEYEQLEEISCSFPGCKHTWCKNCQQSLSSDGPKHSCDGTEELDFLVRQMGWKYCPKCRTPVQKNGGCNHMTCVTPGCNTHFCYRCGKQITRASIPFFVRSAVNAHFKQCML